MSESITFNISFDEELKSTQNLINKNIEHFKIDNPDPSTKDYLPKYLSLMMNHIALAMTQTSICRKQLDFMLSTPTPVQSEKHPQTSHPKEQSSGPSHNPNVRVRRADKPSPKQIQRKRVVVGNQ